MVAKRENVVELQWILTSQYCGQTCQRPVLSMQILGVSTQYQVAVHQIFTENVTLMLFMFLSLLRTDYL